MFDRVYRIVREIPHGQVMTYGQISDQLGGRISAAAVGWALSQCPEDVPWQRVVNAKGTCSTSGSRQQVLLEDEGVQFENGKINLKQYRLGGPDHE